VRCVTQPAVGGRVWSIVEPNHELELSTAPARDALKPLTT
jgi:hypothetical protein